jgi:nucleoside-diphosphate-sugar epimerase
VDPVLVTGASGIAGAHVIAALGSRGLEALGISRERREGLWLADLSDPSAVKALPAFRAVVHCAALTPRSGIRDRDAYRRGNVRATELLAAEAARRGIGTFVFVSTMGRPDQQDEDTGRHYVTTKREAEERLLEIAGGSFSVWIIRAASLYGEHDGSARALCWARQSAPPEVSALCRLPWGVDRR